LELGLGLGGEVRGIRLNDFQKQKLEFELGMVLASKSKYELELGMEPRLEQEWKLEWS
jgi:hypothetical protein